jgi:hypothetical protein
VDIRVGQLKHPLDIPAGDRIGDVLNELHVLARHRGCSIAMVARGRTVE